MDGETPEATVETTEVEQQVPAQDEVKGDEFKALLEAARKESVAERKKRQQLEARLAEIEKAQMTEAERAKAEAEEAKARAEAAETELRKVRVRTAVIERAQAKGFIDPDAAFRLLDVDFDLEGDLKAQADTALDALATERKYLVAAQQQAVTSPANGQTRTGAKLTIDDLKRMSREELAALPKDEVDAVLKGAS